VLLFSSSTASAFRDVVHACATGPEAASKGGMDMACFQVALKGVDLSSMTVEVPVEW
jgi:hypothetical protein